jgi:chromosomal replication initiator protein
MTCPPQVARNSSVSARTDEIWSGVLRRLGDELPPLALDTWIRPLSAEVTAEGLRLACPSAFHRERVRERFLALIERCAEQAAGARVAVVLDVREEMAVAAGEAPEDSAAHAEEPRRAERSASATGARGLAPSCAEPEPGGELPRHDFESFVGGAENALAREACLALVRGRLALSPLYLVAAPGLGKTHLASAVVHEARKRGLRVLYASAEQFTNELMDAIRSQRTAQLKRRYRELLDVLVLEDVHFLHGKKQTQLELLHTLEHLARRGARVLLSAERLPREIPDLDGRLVSRMASGLCAEIEPPGPELRRAILAARAAASGVELPPPCMERIVEAVAGSVRDLEAALVQILASASLLRRPIDPALVESALRKVLPRAGGAGPDPERIAEIVAAHFGTTAAALGSRSRRRDVLLPRQLAMYLCTLYTDASLERIGRAFGRNHPSVGSAVRAVERALASRPAQRAQFDALRAEIEALAGDRKGPRRSRP